MPINAINQIEQEPTSYEQKCLCVLVLDTSGSMNANNAIDQLNQGLQTFKAQTMQDEVTCDHLEVAIVSFNSDVKLELPPTPISEAEMPTLKASGKTQLVKAIAEAQKIVEDRKSYYRAYGLCYYRPWIVVMTDGDPDSDQDVDAMATQIQQAVVANKKFVFVPIGVGDDINEAVLKQLATPDFPPMKMQAVKFCEFFVWLSNSFSSSTILPPNDGVDILDDPTEWLDKMLNN